MTGFTHYAQLPGEVAEVVVQKEYRWRIEDCGEDTRVVAEHRHLGAQLDGRWRPVRSPEREAILRGMTTPEHAISAMRLEVRSPTAPESPMTGAVESR